MYKRKIVFAFAILLGTFLIPSSSLVIASEVTGVLSSSQNYATVTGSEVTGSFGGGGSTGGSSGSISGTVTGGSSGGSSGGGGGGGNGGGGGSGFPAPIAVAATPITNGGGIPITIDNGQSGVTTSGGSGGAVLGASTDVPNYTEGDVLAGLGTDGEGNQLAIDSAIAATPASALTTDTAAVGWSYLGFSWWVWLLMAVLLLAVIGSVYSYWRFNDDEQYQK